MKYIYIRLFCFILMAIVIAGCLPNYFGGDDYSPVPSQSGTSPSFYLGRLGAGASPSTFFTNPNPCPSNTFVESPEQGSTPSIVPPSTQFGWWWLTGPEQSGITSTTQAYNLGYNEGAAAFECWYALIQNRYTTTSGAGTAGLNIFADVELGGESDPTYWYLNPPLNSHEANLNIQTLVGFLDAVGTYTHVSPGVYISSNTINTIMPGLNLDTGCSIYQCPDPYMPVVLWQAGGCNALGIDTTNAPPNISTVQTELGNIESNTDTAVAVSGGYQYSSGPCAVADSSAAIWQYTISGNGYKNDFDIVNSNQVLQNQGSIPAQYQCIPGQIFFTPIDSCGDYFNSTGVTIGTYP